MPESTAVPVSRPAGAISVSRAEAFSDGVFAIAATLLVLEIAVPAAGSGRELSAELLGLWPSYLSYGVSFATIGVMWLTHHFLLGLYERVDRTMLILNLLLLAVVAFIPFSTAVLADYLFESDAGQLGVAITFYGAVLLALCGAFLALARHTASPAASLSDRAVALPALRRASILCLIAMGAYAAAIALGMVWPPASIALILAVALMFAFVRLGRKAAPHP